MGNKLTQEELKEVLEYNPETGIFTRKVTRNNNAKAGSVAGYLNPDGYILIRIYGISYKAHRLAFLYMEGYFPENDVDHINRIKDDNTWYNLREISRSCNMRNYGNRCDNKSGVKGISWDKVRKGWKVQIRISKKTRNLGCFKDFDEAICARLVTEQCLDWSNCDTNSPAFDFVERWICGRRLKIRRNL